MIKAVVLLMFVPLRPASALRLVLENQTFDFLGNLKVAQALGIDPNYHDWVDSKLVEAHIPVTNKNVWNYGGESNYGVYFKGKCPGYPDAQNRKVEWADAVAKMGIPEQFAKQCHHNFYLQGWARQQELFSLVMKTGIQPNQTFFDVGCGSMRLGVKMTEYLDKGNYYGLDASILSLRAAIQYEVPMAGLMSKDPHLLQTMDFKMNEIAPAESIDLVGAFHVLKWRTPVKLFYENAAKVLRKGGLLMIVGASQLADVEGFAKEYGFKKERVGTNLLTALNKYRRFVEDFKSTGTHYFMFRKS